MVAQRYQNFIRLGNQGNMSITYKAFDVQRQEWVVLKTMKGYPEDKRRDDKARQRFQREIETAFKLNHPNILRAIDHGDITLEDQQEAVPYLAYPYIEHGSLEDLIGASAPWEKLSLMQIADIIVQTAQGLTYMHMREQPIVHLDIKPGNILIRRELQPHSVGHLYLCDFGIARQQRRMPVDLASEAWGTPPYMAPEQFDRQYTCETDQYALAVMACYLLTGYYPFYARNREEWRQQHQDGIPDKPSDLNPDLEITPEIDAVILKALSRQQYQRYPTVWAFADAFYAAVRRQFAATPTEKLDQTVPVHPPEPPTVSVVPKFKPIPLHPIDTDDYLEEKRPPQQVSSSIGAPSSRVAKLSLEQLRLTQLLKVKLSARPSMISWSPDGQFLACMFNDNATKLVDRMGSWETVSGVATGHVACWSPNGHVLAIASQQNAEHSKVHIWNRDTPSVWPLEITIRSEAISDLDWSVHGQLAVWPAMESRIRLYSLPKNLLQSQSTPNPRLLNMQNMKSGGTGSLRWSPDGALLAVGTTTGTVVCWRADTHTILWQSTPSKWQVYGLAWSPDGTTLAVALRDKRIVFLSATSGNVQDAWKDLPIVPRVLDFSRQQFLAVASFSHNLYFGQLHARSLSAIYPGQRVVAWSPRRREFATLDAQDDTTLVIWQE